MARRNNHELAFPALSIEGGLLAPDFLNKVAHLEAAEQTEAEYDTPRGLKLRDEIGRYWKIAQNLWQDFAAKRARMDINTHAMTVKDFLEPLMRYVLCFGDLKDIGQVTLDERLFPIGFVAGEGRVPVVFASHDQVLDKPSGLHGDGTRRRSPFLLAQEYLNASEGVLWAVVSNGMKIRILRDNPSLTRPAYIEADLEAIFGEGLYPDFTAFWLLAHASRFGKVGVEPADCPLERWRNTAQEDGIRARDRLRVGVTEALRSLGTGFLAHSELCRRLETGKLTTQSYFEQLLRLVYRFIFLATIEDRELVFAPDATAEAKTRYLTGYSLTRLRQLAARRRSYDRHADLWQALTITFSGLGKGQPALGLPALGGLFASGQCPDLDTAQLDNAALLSALFSLCFFRDGATLSRVNYRDMDSEELGSVYESLLELVPQVTLTAGVRHFGFIGDEEDGSTKGNARKLTGSYYTPDSLVQELIKSALEPVIERTLEENPQEPVKALLALSVCDPACGSGHFLLAAARRIAEEVARLNSVDGNPLPTDYRRALRDVVAHCIYGVDKNPMAVELARTALWLEAYTPERPLTFLDAHLRCGDALLGVLDPSILDAGIPDKAFNALSGDDKEVVKRLKKANREALKAIERAEAPIGQFSLGLQAESEAAAFEHLPDDTLEAVEAKRTVYLALQTRLADSRARLAADLFVAAFVLPKTPGSEQQVPTSQDLWLVQNGSVPRPGIAEAAHRAAEMVQAFHWWQAFPQVRAKGGFDVLLGNPPWEMLQLDPQEYFAAHAPSIANAPHMAARDRLIAALEDENPMLFEGYKSAVRKTEALQSFIHESGRFPASSFGRLNLAYLFAELFIDLKAENGRSGFIVPTGIATDSFAQHIFNKISNGNLVSLLAFENEEFIFRSVHHAFRFCLMTIGRVRKANYVFFARQPAHIHDSRRRFELTEAEFRLLNPNTLTCPVFRSEADAELTKKIYQRVPVFVEENKAKGNPWGVRFQLMFMMSSDSSSFLEVATAERQPMYEAKFIHQYDHRWASYDADGSNDDMLVRKNDPNFSVTPRYWMDSAEVESRLDDKGWKRGWLMGWRDICRATDQRTVIASVMPRVAVGNTIPLFMTNQEPMRAAALLANFNSLVLDFIARVKVGGTHLTFGYLKQFPILTPEHYSDADLAFIVPRVLELTYTAHDLKAWAEDLGYDGPPFPWNPKRRAQLCSELDAYYARLYELTRDELRYILDPADIMGEDYPSETFRVLKNNEMREFGEYRTRRLVLEAWDRLAAEQSNAPASTSVFSEQGLIRNADEADFAGIVIEVIKQYPDGLAAGDLQTLVACAMQPTIVSQFVDQASAARLTELMSKICRVDFGVAIQIIPNVLHRLQTTGACRSMRRGDAVVYVVGPSALPSDIRCNQEHAELGDLLLELDTKRRSNAQAEQTGQQSTDSRRGVA
ncbi:Eco57I restriction-modification methylase domain-containing protein [Chromobacterium haemolyticum]|uniref:Eco57I restriction-modification methylase domain-containing protein n=1 Tax=Chromobacterium haemolyticum TaxID=394935 RepID=UPI00307EA13F